MTEDRDPKRYRPNVGLAAALGTSALAFALTLV